MSEDKHETDLTEPTPEWVDEQCHKFEATLVGFTQEMRLHFRAKARSGRGRWLRPECAAGLYQAMLAHAVSMPLAAGEEAHCANFLAFLWRLNRERPELAVRPSVGPRPMLSGYGLKADLDLVRLLLEIIKSNIPRGPVADPRYVWLHSLDPESAIAELNRKAAE